MTMKPHFLLLFAAVLAGCASAPTDAGDPALATGASAELLRTSEQQYRPGARGELILKNTFTHAIGYNLCTAGLERRQGNGWVSTESDGRVCTMELRLLAPADSASYSFVIPQTLPAGEYRFSTRLENMASGQAQVYSSNSFEVRS